jgi:hypothetical protein
MYIQPGRLAGGVERRFCPAAERLLYRRSRGPRRDNHSATCVLSACLRTGSAWSGGRRPRRGIALTTPPGRGLAAPLFRGRGSPRGFFLSWAWKGAAFEPAAGRPPRAQKGPRSGAPINRPVPRVPSGRRTPRAGSSPSWRRFPRGRAGGLLPGPPPAAGHASRAGSPPPAPAPPADSAAAVPGRFPARGGLHGTRPARAAVRRRPAVPPLHGSRGRRRRGPSREGGISPEGAWRRDRERASGLGKVPLVENSTRRWGRWTGETSTEAVRLFREVTAASPDLVEAWNGSASGSCGEGRGRADSAFSPRSPSAPGTYRL